MMEAGPGFSIFDLCQSIRGRVAFVHEPTSRTPDLPSTPSRNAKRHDVAVAVDFSPRRPPRRRPSNTIDSKPTTRTSIHAFATNFSKRSTASFSTAASVTSTAAHALFGALAALCRPSACNGGGLRDDNQRDMNRGNVDDGRRENVAGDDAQERRTDVGGSEARPSRRRGQRERDVLPSREEDNAAGVDDGDDVDDQESGGEEDAESPTRRSRHGIPRQLTPPNGGLPSWDFDSISWMTHGDLANENDEHDGDDAAEQGTGGSDDHRDMGDVAATNDDDGGAPNDENDGNVSDFDRFLEFELFGHLFGHRMGRGSRNEDEEQSRNQDDGDDDDDDHGDYDSLNVPLRPARDHAYLPTAQPLYPEEWIPAGRHRKRQLQWNGGGGDGQDEFTPAEPRGEVQIANEEETKNALSSTTVTAFNVIPHCTISEPPDPHRFRSITSPCSRIDSSDSGIQNQTARPTSTTMSPSFRTALTPSAPVSPTITLAILEIDDVILFPGSTIPLRLRNPNWVEYLGDLIDDARGLFGSHPGVIGGASSDSSAASALGRAGEVRIGVLPRIDNGARRTRRRPRDAGGRTGRWRIDLIRRGVGARRVPRRRQTGESDDTQRVGSGDGADGGDGIARRDASTINSELDGESEESRRDGTNDQDGRSARLGRDGDRRIGQGSSDEGSDEDDFFHPTSPPNSYDDPLIGRVGCLATITFTHEEAVSSALGDGLRASAATEMEGRVPDAIAGGSSRRQARPSSIVWQRHRGELVVTALGTSRFRIIRTASGNSRQDERSNIYRAGAFVRSDSIGIPLYDVEEWNDGNVAFPPSWIMQMPGDGRRSVFTPSVSAPDWDSSNKNVDDGREVRDSAMGTNSSNNNEATSDKPLQIREGSYNKAIWSLSLRSSTPVIAYQTMWPWGISQKICNMLQETDQLQGLQSILPSAAGVLVVEDARCDSFNTIDKKAKPTRYQVVNPSAFADWLASNMPLSQNDRLDLLEMRCTVQKLRYIHRKIVRKRETLMRCKHCGAGISQMRNVFTVGGAEGTTGAYVNEHGVVHQTVTLRRVDTHSVICIGLPETKDSWFPGYSWTIAYCAICSTHLGWKFQKLGKRGRVKNRNSQSAHGEGAGDEENDPDRPQIFWGLSSITTEENVAPRRVFRLHLGI